VVREQGRSLTCGARAAGANVSGRPSAAPAAGHGRHDLGANCRPSSISLLQGRAAVDPARAPAAALLLQVLYSVRKRAAPHGAAGLQLLFRWFVGLAMDDPIWTPRFHQKRSGCSAATSRGPFSSGSAPAEQRGLLSDEHFTVDGTLIDAWRASRAFQRKDAPPTARTIRGIRP